METANLSTKIVSRAKAAHDAGEYIGIDRQIYDFVIEKHGQERMSCTSCRNAILNNEIRIETTIAHIRAYVLGFLLFVDTQYKNGGFVPKVYIKDDYEVESIRCCTIWKESNTG